MNFESYTLGSRDIRNLIFENRRQIIGNITENQIRSSSFEPTLGEDCYVLDADVARKLRPVEGKSITACLNNLNPSEYNKVKILDGYEFKTGYTYLIHLNEKINFDGIKFIKNSPKSTFGRLFLESVLWADYNPCIDEIHSQYSGNKTTDMWVMIDPRAFNLIMQAGQSINQLKFFEGSDYKIRDSVLKGQLQTNPILFKDGKFGLERSRQIIADGLQVHLDLQGRYTDGIVALRARKNPEAIDTRIDINNPENKYPTDRYFDFLKAKDNQLEIEVAKHYLLATQEVLKFPAHMSADLRPSSHIGTDAILHFAGFIDPKFFGDLVLELILRAKSNVTLEHGTPIGRMDMFYNSFTDKPYDLAGSNYPKQRGPCPAKYFNWNYFRKD